MKSSYHTLPPGWAILPGAVLQVIGRCLAATDAASARLTCKSWGQGISLSCICLNLADPCMAFLPHPPGMVSSFSTVAMRHALYQQQHMQQQVGLQDCSRQPFDQQRRQQEWCSSSSACRATAVLQQMAVSLHGTTQCSVIVPTAGISPASTCDCMQQHASQLQGPGCRCKQPGQQQVQLQQQHSALQTAGGELAPCVIRLAEFLAGLASLDSLSLCSDSQSKILPSTVSSTDLAVAVVQCLLERLQLKLHTLKLDLAPLLFPNKLSPLLLHLRQLRSLTVIQWSVAAICSIPSLPNLQHLSIEGRFSEPIPPSYSCKQRPLLPLLPQLTSLQLMGMPLDLRAKEIEDICDYNWKTGRLMNKYMGQLEADQPAIQHQRAQHKHVVGIQSPAAGQWSSTGCSMSSCSSSVCAQCTNTRVVARDFTAISSKVLDTGAPASMATLCFGCLQQHSMRAAYLGQWVGNSIAKQCPQLLELSTDMQMGPALYQLKHLAVVHGPQPCMPFVCDRLFCAK